MGGNQGDNEDVRKSGWTDMDDCSENFSLFKAFENSKERLDGVFYADPFRLARNEVPTGLALLKVDRMLLHMHHGR
jgi:hypothetical protein